MTRWHVRFILYCGFIPSEAQAVRRPWAGLCVPCAVMKWHLKRPTMSIFGNLFVHPTLVCDEFQLSTGLGRASVTGLVENSEKVPSICDHAVLYLV